MTPTQTNDVAQSSNVQTLQSTESKFQTVERVVEKAASTPVPVPLIAEIQDGVQLFLTLEPYMQKAVLALIHHFHVAPKQV